MFRADIPDQKIWLDLPVKMLLAQEFLEGGAQFFPGPVLHRSHLGP